MRVQAPASRPPPAPSFTASPPSARIKTSKTDSLTSLSTTPATTYFCWDSTLSFLSSVYQTLTHLWRLSLDTAQVVFDNIMTFFTRFGREAPPPSPAPASNVAVPTAAHPNPPPEQTTLAASPPAREPHAPAAEPPVAPSPAAPAVVAAPVRDPFSSLPPPSDMDRRNIDEIINSTANTHVAILLFSGRAVELKRKGDSVARNVHPLQFLAYIFREPEAGRPNLSEAMRTILSNALTWPAFMNGTPFTSGLANQLNAKHQQNEIVPYLEGFAAALHRTSSLPDLKAHAAIVNWDAFIKTLIATIASPAHPALPAVEPLPVPLHAPASIIAPDAAAILTPSEPAMDAVPEPATASSVAAPSVEPVPAAAVIAHAPAAVASDVRVESIPALTDEQRTIIESILTRLGSVTVMTAWKLTPYTSTIVKQWDSLGAIHPLQFLELVCSDPAHMGNLIAVTKNWAVYVSFYATLTVVLNKRSFHPGSAEIEDFAVKIGLSADTSPALNITKKTLRELIVEKEWVTLVKALAKAKEATLTTR